MFNSNLNLKFLQATRKYFSSKPTPKLPPCDFVPKKYQGPSYEKLCKVRSANLASSLKTTYTSPLALYQGHMQWLFDIHGRRYLDMFGGICTVSVGHCHPKVTASVKEQMDILVHCSNIYLHPSIHEYAEQLTSKLPGNLNVVYFVNSGSEANDLAVLLARTYTRNFDVVSLMNGYHGMTYLTMGLSNTSGYQHPVPPPNGTHQTMNADVFRGPWGGARCRDSIVQTTRSCECAVGTCEASNQYKEQLYSLYSHCLSKGGVAAFIAESIQGVGGTVQYPHGYLKAAYDLVKDYGGLYIADEVQTGFGRTGDHFWGFEMHEVQPDIVTMAKGIGNGFPLSAVVTTSEIAQGFNKGNWFNTFGGNPIACTAGKAVLEIIEEENYQEKCKTLGTYLLERLAELRQKYLVVGDVRGKGLMIGIELVGEVDSVKPLPNPDFSRILDTCRDMGLLIGRGGNYGNVLRIKPPMCITKDDADFTIAVLDRVFDMYMNGQI